MHLPSTSFSNTVEAESYPQMYGKLRWRFCKKINSFLHRLVYFHFQPDRLGGFDFAVDWRVYQLSSQIKTNLTL